MSFLILHILLIAVVSAKELWRSDWKCGGDWPLANGESAQCDPYGPYPCCSATGWCGITENHCDCTNCVDYRDSDCPKKDLKCRVDELKRLINEEIQIAMGPLGPKGERGDAGADGDMGPKGDVGDDGYDGAPGADGEYGPKGDKGYPGKVGRRGETGSPGGQKGSKGAYGEKGEKGYPGIVGTFGRKGSYGAQGEAGLQGEKGEPGRIAELLQICETYDPDEAGNMICPAEEYIKSVNDNKSFECCEVLFA